MTRTFHLGRNGIAASFKALLEEIIVDGMMADKRLERTRRDTFLFIQELTEIIHSITKTIFILYQGYYLIFTIHLKSFPSKAVQTSYRGI